MAAPFSNSKSRFSDRVDDYVRYRHRYPKEVVGAVQDVCGLRPEHLIADVGCGTGFLAEIFLQNGNRVIGIEPNEAMREAGSAYLSRYPKFSMRDGNAEETTLEDASVDLVMAGQAFHWFEPQKTRREFARVLRRGGWVVLVWNDRDVTSTAFSRAYEEFLRKFGVDYEEVAHSHVASMERLEQFFAPKPVRLTTIESAQEFDYEGLNGRLFSSSYIPKSGPGYEEMMKELPGLFGAHAEDGRVKMKYETKVYCGQL